jgi:hypothetical protein
LQAAIRGGVSAAPPFEKKGKVCGGLPTRRNTPKGAIFRITHLKLAD